MFGWVVTTGMEARTGFAVVLVLVLAVLSALIVEPFLSYVLAAILLAFVLYPVQRRAAARVDERLAALLLVSLTVALVVGPVTVLFDVALSELDTAPETVTDIVTQVEQLLERRFGVNLRIATPADRLAEQFASIVTERSSRLLELGLHAFLGVLLFLFLLYYLLKDGGRFVGWTKRVTPLPRTVQDELYAEAEEVTWAVLKGHVFVASLQGFVSGVGLFALGIPDAPFWTVVMMFLAMIPIVGVAPVMGGAAIYLAVNGRVVEAALLVVYGMTVVAITDDYLRALVVDRESSLHSGVILLGVFGAAYLFGAIGIFLGPIVLALFKATIEVFSEYYDLA